MTASTVSITAPAVPSLGDERMSFLMNPCGADGFPINGGNHYANANSLEDARDWAARVLADDTHLGYVVRSVSIFGKMMRLGSYGWEAVRGGAAVSEVIESDRPIPPAPGDENLRCYRTTVMDYLEVIHPRRADGTCHCGQPDRQY